MLGDQALSLSREPGLLCILPQSFPTENFSNIFYPMSHINILLLFSKSIVTNANDICDLLNISFTEYTPSPKHTCPGYCQTCLRPTEVSDSRLARNYNISG